MSTDTDQLRHREYGKGCDIYLPANYLAHPARAAIMQGAHFYPIYGMDGMKGSPHASNPMIGS